MDTFTSTKSANRGMVLSSRSSTDLHKLVGLNLDYSAPSGYNTIILCKTLHLMSAAPPPPCNSFQHVGSRMRWRPHQVVGYKATRLPMSVRFLGGGVHKVGPHVGHVRGQRPHRQHRGAPQQHPREVREAVQPERAWHACASVGTSHECTASEQTNSCV